MAGRGMNDAEVASEMKKMIDFIRQEAEEKAREIQVKADEEHNIEKAKIVRQETLAIEAQYEKKMKQAKSEWKIAQSNYINKCRLQILQSREEQLNVLLNEVKNRLKKVPENTAKYTQLLKHLLLQGLILLNETKVVVQCRKADLKLVEGQVVADAQKQFESKTGLRAEITIEASLPDTKSGGVIISSNEGKVVCDNTLETRLSLASDQMLPAMRVLLFGIPEYRRFFD